MSHDMQSHIVSVLSRTALTPQQLYGSFPREDWPRLDYALKPLLASGEIVRAYGLLQRPGRHGVLIEPFAPVKEPKRYRGGPGTELTTRQELILAMYREGKTRAEIATACGITAGTVCDHLANIARKMGVERREQLKSVEALTRAEESGALA